MLQSSYGSSGNKKQPQKFIPRRDLFPDAELPPNKPSPARKQEAYGKKQNIPIQPPIQEQKSKIQSRRAKAFDPSLLILFGLGLFVLWPILKKKQPFLASQIQSTVGSTLENPKTLQLLHSVSPYLENNEQEIMYTITGILELISLAKDVMNHSYHDKHQSAILQVPMDPLAKKVEMLKVIRPFVPENVNHHLDHAVKSFDTADKLSRNIEIFRNNRALAPGHKIGTIETVSEVLRVIKPVLPEDYQQQADKAVQMLKMAEAMEATNKINKEMKKDKKTKENEAFTFDTETSADTPNGSSQAEQMLNTFKSMLNDEQKESVDVIMRMAQMLAQPNNDEQ